MDEPLTIFEAAHALGCTPDEAKPLLQRHSLTGPRGGRRKVLTLEAVEALAVENYRWKSHVDDPDSYWVTIGQAANILGVSGQRVKQLLSQDRLPHLTHRGPGRVRLMRREQIEMIANARLSRKLQADNV